MAEQARILDGQLHLGGEGDMDIFIGDKATERISMHGAQPTTQRAGGDQTALGAVTTVGANTGTAGAGLTLIGDTSLVNQASNLMNDAAAVQEDLAALFTLVNEMRAALVEKGIIKGSA